MKTTTTLLLPSAVEAAAFECVCALLWSCRLGRGERKGKGEEDVRLHFVRKEEEEAGRRTEFFPPLPPSALFFALACCSCIGTGAKVGREEEGEEEKA